MIILQGLLAVALAAADDSVPPPPQIVERVYSLEEAQRLSRQNDARLLSAEQDTRIASARETEARLQFLPELGLQASATKFDARYPFALSGESRNILLFPGAPENIYSGRGYWYMSIYEGGKQINTLRLAQAYRKQATSNFESVKRDVQLATKEAFFRLLLDQEKLSAARKHQETVEAARRADAANAWEKIEIESLAEEARSAGAEAAHDLDMSKLAFLKSLNLELDTPFRVIGALEPRNQEIDVRKAVLWAMELRPELQSETYKAQMDAISVNLALGRRTPTLFVAGDYELTGHKFPLKQNNWDATMGIKIPFSYDFYSQLQQKRAEQRQGQLKRAELQDRVRLEVRQAHENLRYWQPEFPLRQAHLKRVRSLYEEAGRAPGNHLARARASSALTRNQNAYFSAVTEQILAMAKLEWAVGRELSK